MPTLNLKTGRDRERADFIASVFAHACRDGCGPEDFVGVQGEAHGAKIIGETDLQVGMLVRRANGRRGIAFGRIITITPDSFYGGAIATLDSGEKYHASNLRPV